jgi:hypothetical protein
MTHKKVAEVTLNAAGKAETLTLAPPWLYNGERGPFTLTSVDHGHQIVKGATSDGSAAPAPKAKAPKSVHRGSIDPDSPSPHSFAVSTPAAPRGHEIIVYRAVLVKDDEPSAGESRIGHEVCGWFQLPAVLGKKELAARTHQGLDSYLPDGSDPKDWRCESFRWTQKMQDAARKAGDSGSPWSGANHG